MNPIPKELSMWFAMTTEGPVDLYGYIIDGLVLHSAHDPKTGPETKCWRISHVASGGVVIPHVSYTEAISLLDTLLGSGLDWRRTSVQATPAVLQLTSPYMAWYWDGPHEEECW